jgi:hypothetical protein
MKISAFKAFTLFFILIISLPVSSQTDCSVNGLFVDVKTTPSAQYFSNSTRTVCQLPEFYENEPLIPTNIYGSRTDRKTVATGFYYTKQIDGRWWVVDPDGYLNICRAVNALAQGTGISSKDAFSTKFGTTNVWMDATKKLLSDNGFYCAGAWSSTASITSNQGQGDKPLAYTIILNWMSGYGSTRTYQQSGHMGYPNDCIFVFEQGFKDYCETKGQLLATNSTDKNLFGYFSDNELPFYNKSLNNFIRLGKTSLTDENYLATKKWLIDNNLTEADTTKADVQARFLGFVGETYFSIVNNAIKKYDPNHMYIGSRVNIAEARDNKYFMQSAGKYVDILSVNYYSVWTPNIGSMNDWGANLGKPFMVTEFYTKGEDSGLANNSGAGWIVKTQLDRGFAYQNYTLALLESKYCVGWHWFKYFDNDPSIQNAEPSNIDGNKGIVNILYEPYTALLNKMKEVNLRAYNLIDYFDKKPEPQYIYPEADAYFKGTINYGSDDRLGIKNTTDIAFFRESFLRFDLTGATSNPNEVKLRLFVLRAGDAGITYLAEFVTDDTWTESSITSSAHPAGASEIGRWKHNSDVNLDIKKAYSETIAADKKLSIKLSAVESSVSQLEYASRENTSAGKRPRLEISEKINAPANTTKLSELIIDDKRLASFHPDTLVYRIILPTGTTVNPKIEFKASNSQMNVAVSAPFSIVSETESDRTAIINTTSADGLQHGTYTIKFSVAKPVGVKDFQGISDIIIFPNPANTEESLHIKTESYIGAGATVSIADATGKTLLRNKFSGTETILDISGFLPGFYLLSLAGQTWKTTRKIIIQ